MKKQLLSITLLLSVGSSQAMMAVLAAQQKSIPKVVKTGEPVVVQKNLKGALTTQGPITAIQDGANLKVRMHGAGEGSIHVDGKKVHVVYGAHADIKAVPTVLSLGSPVHAENTYGKRFEQINAKDNNAGKVNISHKNGKLKITPKSEGKVVIADKETGEVVKTFHVKDAAQ